MLAERAPHLAARSKSVGTLAVATGAVLGLADEELEALSHAAALHDVGKMADP